jgi:hypothetical protein
MSFPYVSTIYYERNLIVYNNLYLLVNKALNLNMRSTLDTYSCDDFIIDILQEELRISWKTLDYEIIKITMTKLANAFGSENYHWDLYYGIEFMAECRSGTFELDGELSIRDDEMIPNIIRADIMFSKIQELLI